MSVSEQLAAGQTFGRYQIVRPIGEGGMGVVYEAIHPALRKRFAIKTLHPTYASKQEARLRFVREAEAAACINHPNVVAVSDVGIEGNVPYMVMELLEGQTLDQLFAAKGPLAVQEAIGLLLPIISAVAAGHDRGIIHRDLKPQNIFLARGHRGEVIPKVLDFGVSKVTGDESPLLTKTMAVLGTAAYMSPEQAQGARRVDLQSDQYSLGLILHEAFTGCRAYSGESVLEVLHKAALGIVRPVREFRSDLPPEIEAALERMLAAAIGHRYPSLYEAGQALLAFADERTRLTLAGEFTRGPERPSGTGAPEAPAPQPSQGSLPGSPVSALPTGSLTDVRSGGTRILPSSEDHGPSDTTMRHAAAQVSTARQEGASGSARSSRRRGVILAAAGCLVAVGGGLLVSSMQSPRTGKAADSKQASGAARPAAPGAATSPAVSKLAAPATEPAAALFEIRATPPDAELTLDGHTPVRGRIELLLPLGGGSHLLRVAAPGYRSKVVQFGAGERPPSEVHLERIASPTTPATTKTASNSAKATAKTTATATAMKASPHAAAPGTAPAGSTLVQSGPPPAPNVAKPNETVRSPEGNALPKRGANNSMMIPVN